MGPKKKKQPKNAFLFFMMDWKEEKEEQGFKFPGGLRDVQASEECQNAWKYLPPNLMDRYKRMEKEAKEKDKNDQTNKYTSTGKTYQEQENEKREAQAFENRMCSEISIIIDECQRNLNVLHNRCFYLIHANTYIYWGEQKQWVPCEVAISEFNLSEGVRRTYHVFPAVITKDNRLPLGYKLESKHRRETIHFIPDPEDFEDRIETNYDKIAEDILKFLKPNGGKDLPPLFTMEDDFNTNSNMSAVKDFLENVAGDEVIDFRVYKLPLFFYYLRNVCAPEEDKFPTLGLALQQLERDYYNFCEEIACDFHVTSEGFSNCSLAIVRRWVFLICEFCCPYLDLPLKPGQHCVTTANVKSNCSLLSSDFKQVSYKKPVSHTPIVAKQNSSSPAQDKPVNQKVHAGPVQAELVKASPVEATLSMKPTKPGIHPQGASAVPTQSVWGRGVNNLSSRMQNVSLEDKKPGQVAAPMSQVFDKATVKSGGTGITMIDYSKVVDPSTAKKYNVGQSPNIVSVVVPDESSRENLRLPSSRGRGESLAMALGKKEPPSPSFSQEDFPAIGASSGRPQRPIASSWGRGFSFGPKPS